MGKKRVLINTDYPILKTGLAKNGKLLAEYLYKTGKYEIGYYACGVPNNHPDFQRFPYKVYGALPNNPQEINQISGSDEGTKRFVAYGGYLVDKVVADFKPTHFIGINDSWAFNGYWEKQWYNKIHFIPHITLDSLPFLKDQKTLIEKSSNFKCWTPFAEREAKALGYNHVETIPGMVDDTHFIRLSDEKRLKLRNKYNLSSDAFICGYVFRNQLRKEVKPLLEGFKEFLIRYPNVKAYLLLHTSWVEGWSIPNFIEELKIPSDRILTTYICKKCSQYEIKPFSKNELDCPYCKEKNSQSTTQISLGVTDIQLNEIYNLMDCYYGAANASGLEIPIVEALYTGLPIGVVDYAGTNIFVGQPFTSVIKNSWTVQIGTQFRRAIPDAHSVYRFLESVHISFKPYSKDLAQTARSWALANFSVEVLGKRWETLLDSLPSKEYDYDFAYKVKNETYPYKGEEISGDADFIIDLYKNILYLENENNSESPGVQNWLRNIAAGQPRKDIYNFFIEEARKENQKNKPTDIKSWFNTERPNKRALIVIKESRGDCIYVRALFKSFKEQYPNVDLYVATEPQYFDMFTADPYLFKLIPYIPQFENEMWCIGTGKKQGEALVDIYIHPAIQTQRQLNYLSNNNPLLP